MKQIVFLSGLPRTGSTVLGSMLNQHPNIHATTTSPVADLVSIALEKWPLISGALKNPESAQFGNITDGIIQGAHRHILKDIVVDKNRLWPRLAAGYYHATGIKQKIICTVRSIPEIMASYLILVQRNGSNNFVDEAVKEAGLVVNTKNRCKILFEQFINHPYTSLKIGHNSGAADMLYLEYSTIVEHPQATIDRICNFIGCSSYGIDTGNLQSMEENDHFHGGLEGLHHVRPELGRTSPPPEDVIGKHLVGYYNSMKLDFWNKPSTSKPVSLARNQPVNIQSKFAGGSKLPEPLEGDSLDYDLLYRAACAASKVDGLYCEIGVRRGGSLRYIIDAINDSTRDCRTVVAIDPYGNIDYNATEGFRGKLDYTNSMKHSSMPHIYRYLDDKNVNLVFFNVEDTEFFNRFSDGVPVYNEYKEVVNHYAFVFFDGPHDVASLQAELDFFFGRVNRGAVFVFDDVESYPHEVIHNRLLEYGFKPLEYGAQRRKISYRLD